MPSNSEQFGLRISEQRIIKIRTICEIPSQVLRFIGLVHVLVTFVLCLYEKGIKYTIPRLRNIYISVIVSRYYRLPKMPLINGIIHYYTYNCKNQFISGKQVLKQVINVPIIKWQGPRLCRTDPLHPSIFEDFLNMVWAIFLKN